MADTVTFKDIERLLLARLPELHELVEKQFGSYYDLKTETPEAYPVFEDVLKKFLLDLLSSGDPGAILPRIFAFLEEMANSADRDVTDLLGIAILEPLVFRPERIRIAWSYMGRRTKELAHETAQFGGWLNNLPAEESD
jgi:hypothetical protein